MDHLQADIHNVYISRRDTGRNVISEACAPSLDEDAYVAASPGDEVVTSESHIPAKHASLDARVHPNAVRSFWQCPSVYLKSGTPLLGVCRCQCSH